MKPNIAVDGPAGAGKSTICKIISERLGLTYIDTGAMYRALALKLLQYDVDSCNELLVTKLALDTKIVLKADRVYLDGSDVTQDIRKPEVTRIVSKVAAIPGVRESMLALQKKMAAKGGVIMDGRDITTRVIPDADYKFYISAAPEERALRRYKELLEKGHHVDIKQVLNEIIERDRLDSERKHSPLRVAEDAVFIDTTGRTVDEVAEEIIRILKGGGL